MARASNIETIRTDIPHPKNSIYTRYVKRILDIEVMLVVTIAFLLFIICGQLVSHDILHIEYIKHLVNYLKY